MMSPHPPWERIRRRNTVSVTPTMGASTVAGCIRVPPIWNPRGNILTSILASWVTSAETLAPPARLTVRGDAEREHQSSVGIPGRPAGRHGRVLRPIAPEREGRGSAARGCRCAAQPCRATPPPVGRAGSSEPADSRSQKSSREESRSKTIAAAAPVVAPAPVEQAKVEPPPPPEPPPVAASRRSQLRSLLPSRLLLPRHLRRRVETHPSLHSRDRSPSRVERWSPSGWAKRYRPNATGKATRSSPRSTSRWWSTDW